MSGQRLQVAATAVVLLLVTIIWSGCGDKDKQSTDLLNQPPGGETATTPGQPQGDWPPPPPAVPGGAGTETGAGDAASEAPATALPPRFVDVYFDFDQYRLTAEARQTLAENARMLGDAELLTVVIEGHCDERGTVEYNLALGEKRAAAVKEYLVRYGIDESRLRTVSFGEERPVDTSQTEEGWARNRRAHLRPR